MKRAWLVLAIAALPRLLVFPFNENLYGDAVARTWLAELWAQTPHVMASFDQGCRQFGPLHLYLLALAEWVWPAAEHAGRLVSLVAGVATVLPLDALTRRLFGKAAGTWAVVGFALWGLHIQCSTTAASEALNLLCVVGSVAAIAAWLETRRPASLLLAALCLNLACATRYDSWLLVPLMGIAVGLQSRQLRWGVLFTLASSAFAIPWLFGSWVDRGAPLYPFEFIDTFHRNWVISERQIWGWRYPWLTGSFWPGVAVVTLTPLLALAGMAGLVRAWRARSGRWLVAIVVVPTILYTLRSTLFGSFAPIARFTVKEVALLLPFAWYGAQWLTRWPRTLRALTLAGFGLAIAWPVTLGLFTFRREGKWEDMLRPVSPTSTNEAFVRRAAGWLDANVARRGGVFVIDVDPHGYDDLQVSFFSRVPFNQGARLRAPTFDAHLGSGKCLALARFDGGALGAQLTPAGPNSVSFRGATYDEVPLDCGRLHLYRLRE